MQDHPNYLTNLQRWIYDNVIIHITKRQELYEGYLNIKSMQTFARAFTHETYSDNNYELYEMIGDKYLSACLVQLIIVDFPNLSPSDLTEMNAYYSSDEVQSEIMRKCGGDKFIRVGNSIKEGGYNVAGDVFEALAAAVFIVSDSVIPGSGYTACYRFTQQMYRHVKFELNITTGNHKTVVHQIFSGISGVEPPTETSTTNLDKSITIKVSLNKSNINLIDQYKRNSLNLKVGTVIGEATNENKKIASRDAYKQARENLKKLGIDTSWSEDVKFQIDIRSDNLSSLWPRVKAKGDRSGYINYKIKRSHKISTDSRRVLIFYGVKPDGTMTLLSSAEGDNHTENTKIALFNNYLNDNTSITKV